MQPFLVRDIHFITDFHYYVDGNYFKEATVGNYIKLLQQNTSFP